MPQLSDAQLQGLAARELDAGTEIATDWRDPSPVVSSWEFALFGGGGPRIGAPPERIFEAAFLYGDIDGAARMRPNFVEWVKSTIREEAAIAQAEVLIANVRRDIDAAAQRACSDALARLCVIAGGLSLSADNGTAQTPYRIVMGSRRWHSGEHWALGLANNVGRPDYPPVHYCQSSGRAPVSTRARMLWGGHPILTEVYVTGLHNGHVNYLRHAAGWPR